MNDAGLSKFVLARTAEDAGLAQEAMSPDFSGGGYGLTLGSRVLADCEAKRRIVAMAAATGDPTIHPDAWVAMKSVLRDLAVTYDRHPDYDERWRP